MYERQILRSRLKRKWMFLFFLCFEPETFLCSFETMNALNVMTYYQFPFSLLLLFFSRRIHFIALPQLRMAGR